MSDKVDAIVTFEPSKSIILGVGGNEVSSSKKIPGEIVDVLVVHEEMLDESRTAINGLLAGWFRAVDLLKEEDQYAYSFISIEFTYFIHKKINIISFII